MEIVKPFPASDYSGASLFMTDVGRSRSRSPPGRPSARTVAAEAPVAESRAELLAQLEEALLELGQSALLASTEVLTVAVPLVAQAGEVLVNAVRADRLAIFRAEQQAIDSDSEREFPASAATPRSLAESPCSQHGCKGEGSRRAEGSEEEGDSSGEGKRGSRAKESSR